MYRVLKDFIEDWRRETASTLRIFRALTDASLSQKVTPNGRSLGFLAWHITIVLNEMSEKTGLSAVASLEDAAAPNSAKEIAEAYRSAARSIEEQSIECWNDVALSEEVDMYGEKWKRGFALASLLRHQTHHRGQMTVLMRQAGLSVPGVCGPSREEWAKWGMPAMQ